MIAKFVHLLNSSSCLRFAPSLDRVFKRVLFRSSNNVQHRSHPIQRVSKAQLLNVLQQNYSNTKKTNNDQNNNQTQESEELEGEQIYTTGPHRGKTKREIIVSNLLSIMNDLYDCFDVYKIDANEESKDGLHNHNINHSHPSTTADVSLSYIDPRELLCALRVISHPGLEASEPHVRYWFDLYAHSWLILDEHEHINIQNGTVTSMNDSIEGRQRTAGGGSSLLPSSWSNRWETSTMKKTDSELKYNAVGVRSGTPINQKLSASAASLLLSGFAKCSEKTESIPWRELHMACVVTATNDFEFELLSGLATRAFLGPNNLDIKQAVTLEHLLESSR